MEDKYTQTEPIKDDIEDIKDMKNTIDNLNIKHSMRLSLLIDEIDELKDDLYEAKETIKMYEKLRKATCNIS
tara:strand:- start:309 stop:524 length:216 start_codon:yes stop_codon:yes gene_type:complete